MTIKEFFNAYLGLWIETNKTGDTSTYDQCIDLWRTFNRKVVNAPDIFGNPPDIWNNYQQDFYDKIPNTPEGVPQLGDVIVWGTKYGKYGHIAICTEIANVNKFTSFDQNDPLDEPCHYQEHNYTGVLGWLRPKIKVEDSDSDEKLALEFAKQSLAGLSEDDKYKDGNLEGYIRGITDEHLRYNEYENKAKILDGFVSKWIIEWNITGGASLADVENEMTKLISFEDTANQFRDAIEKAVKNEFTDDKALLKALEALEIEKDSLQDALDTCRLNGTTKKIIKSFRIWKYIVKICRG